MELLDSKTESDRFSTSHPPKLIVARVDISSEEEEEGMDLKQMTALKGLLANRNKGSTSKEAPKTQVHPSLPPPPSPSINLELHANPNLKKKRPVQNIEEGEVAPQRGTKQQRTTKDLKDKKANSMESRDEAEVRRQQRTWASQIELEGATVSWDASIWVSQRR